MIITVKIIMQCWTCCNHCCDNYNNCHSYYYYHDWDHWGRGGDGQQLQNKNRNTVWIKFQELFAKSCHRNHIFTITSSISRATQCKHTNVQMRQDVKQTQAYCDALTRIITLACSLTLQSFITHHIVHQWIRNWILDRHQNCRNAEEKQLQNMNRNTVWIKIHKIFAARKYKHIYIYRAEECVCAPNPSACPKCFWYCFSLTSSKMSPKDSYLLKYAHFFKH